MQSCNLRKHIPEGEKFLSKVEVKGAPDEYKSNLENLVRQQPNYKTFRLIRIPMWKYLWASSKKRAKKEEDRLGSGKWEMPVLYDSALMASSITQMKSFLFDKGLFYATITTEEKVKHEYQVKVIFKVEKGRQFRLAQFSREVPDTALNKIIADIEKKSVVKINKDYDGSLLGKERDRITVSLREHGYYDFLRDFIYFKLDTSLSGDSVAAKMVIDIPENRLKHRLYKIGDVSVETEFIVGDTIVKPEIDVNGIKYRSFNPSVKPQILDDLVLLRPGELYSPKNYQNTLNKLSALRLYKFVDIQFIKDADSMSDTGKLHTVIRLSLLPKQGYDFNLELNTTEQSASLIQTSRLLGTSVAFIYRHKNIGRQAIAYEAKPRASIEFPVGKTVSDAPKKANYELGFGNSFITPLLLIPRRWISPSLRSTGVQTAININYLFEDNRIFARSTFNGNLTYQLRKNNVRHFITPFDLSFVNTVYGSDSLSKELKTRPDPLIRNLFDPHWIGNVRYGILVNQQPLSLVTSRYYVLRGNAEIGGHLFALLDGITQDKDRLPGKKTGEVFGVNYFQYFRLEGEGRYYLPVFKRNNLVGRAIVGVGIPYGNSTLLPFEKRFYVGGANSLRAWRVRTLGPGTLPRAQGDTGLIPDRSGDIRLEANLEYRFPLISVVNGALFLDVGNVFTYRADPNRPNSTFNPKAPFSAFAVGTGFGTRFDFSFFIFRVDFGLPLIDPTNEGSKKVKYSLKGFEGFDKGVINIGIGYPF